MKEVDTKQNIQSQRRDDFCIIASSDKIFTNLKDVPYLELGEECMYSLVDQDPHKSQILKKQKSMDSIVNDLFNNWFDLKWYNDLKSMSSCTQDFLNKIARDSFFDLKSVIEDYFETEHNKDEITRVLDEIEFNFVKVDWSYENDRKELQKKCNSHNSMENVIYSLFVLSLYKRFKSQRLFLTILEKSSSHILSDDEVQEINTILDKVFSSDNLENNNDRVNLEIFISNIVWITKQKDVRKNILKVFSRISKYRSKTAISTFMKVIKWLEYVLWKNADLDLFWAMLHFDTLEELREYKEILREMCVSLQWIWLDIKVIKESDKWADIVDNNLITFIKNLDLKQASKNQSFLKRIIDNNEDYHQTTRFTARKVLYALLEKEWEERNIEIKQIKENIKKNNKFSHNTNSNTNTSAFHNLTIKIHGVPIEFSFRISDEVQVKNIVNETINEKIVLLEKGQKELVLNFAKKDSKLPCMIERHEEDNIFCFRKKIIDTMDTMNHGQYKEKNRMQFIMSHKYSDLVSEYWEQYGRLQWEINKMSEYIYEKFKNIKCDGSFVDTKHSNKEVLLVNNEIYHVNLHKAYIKTVLIYEYVNTDPSDNRYIPSSTTRLFKLKYKTLIEKIHNWEIKKESSKKAIS